MPTRVCAESMTIATAIICTTVLILPGSDGTKARKPVTMLIAAAPIVVLLGALGLLNWSAPKAAATGLIAALGVAIGVYGMPWRTAAAAAGCGACFGLFPIGWIVFAAVFLYVLTVETGEFEKVKASVAALSADQRIQALLIAFGFGAFIEGAAGFVRMEVLTPHDDPREFWLLTYWSDEASFQAWHRGHLHHESHQGIPKGLRLDPKSTEIRYFEHVCF